MRSKLSHCFGFVVNFLPLILLSAIFLYIKLFFIHFIHFMLIHLFIYLFTYLLIVYHLCVSSYSERFTHVSLTPNSRLTSVLFKSHSRLTHVLFTSHLRPTHVLFSPNTSYLRLSHVFVISFPSSYSCPAHDFPLVVPLLTDSGNRPSQ